MIHLHVKTHLKLLVLVSLFSFGIGLNAQERDITVSINRENVTIREIFQEIEKQTQMSIAYNQTKFNDTREVSLNVKEAPLTEALNVVLRGSGYTYEIRNDQIMIVPVKPLQVNKITGQVIDEDGEPLIGATIVVKGVNVGTTTNIEGEYTIEASVGNTLVFSYIGYSTQEIKVGQNSVINVTLKDNLRLDEVVVTALGIKREAKALTYNVQTLDSEQLTIVKDANFINSLSGKIAGVNINQSSSGTGGSTRVVMRGTKSLFGENNALYVLDGIPLSSLKSRQTTNFMEQDIQGDSEGISNLNPDDIDNISVLTGAAAAALYGNRGSNGVVLITTKAGHSGKPKITYSNSTTFSSPFVLPEFQNTYGRSGDTYFSWGDKLENPSSYRPEDFFQTGYNTMNSISLSTGSESHQIYASAGAVNAEGIVPNNEYTRYNFTFKSSSELIKDKLTLDIGFNYIQQKDQNAIAQGLYYNPLVAIYLFPPGDDINRYRAYKVMSSERNFEVQNWPEEYQRESLEGLIQNPFWTTNSNLFNNKRSRYFMTGSINYKITDWINFSARTRIDKSESDLERRLYASTNKLFAKSDAGHYSDYELNHTNIYADFLVNIDKQINDSFHLSANLGGSINDEISEFEGYDGPLISAVDFFHISNVKIDNKDRIYTHTRTNSLYATLQAGYKSFLYLDLTGRLDYFSTMKSKESLPAAHVFYPSVGLSAVLSELIPKNSVLSFWKIRASYAQVGNPPSPYLLTDYTTLDNGALSSTAYYPIKTLEAEKTKAYEVGTDIRLWNNKVSLGMTYYNTNTFNQLFTYNLPPSTGYTYAFANAGKVNNWGIELSLGFSQKLGPVDWDLNLAYTLNRNKIKELLPEEIADPTSGSMMPAPTEFEVSSAGSYKMILKEGGTMSDIYVTSFKRDHNGYINVHPQTGRFEIDQDNFFKIGEASPKYNLGIRNDFAWKGLSLGFMIDARVGGVVVSSTQAMMDQYGVSKASAEARDRGGVNINSGQVDSKLYYEIVGGGRNGYALSEYTYSATNVRLRELSLSYNLPKNWFRDKLDVSVSLIGRNLWMIYKKAPFDPELTSNTGTYFQGYDYFMPPSQRNIGFGVKVSF